MKNKQNKILDEISLEEKKFQKTLEAGLKEFQKLLETFQAVFEKTGKKTTTIAGKQVFKLYDTYGFPLEMTAELAQEANLQIDTKGFEEAFKKHQEKSRLSLEKKFKGGLADNSQMTTALHTATHLLHQALRNILGEHVAQRGSNITGERLRFDFSHPEKLSEDEKIAIENMINEQIKEKLPIIMKEMTVEEAKKQGAIGLFTNKYGEKVKVYSIGNFSKEICGGPHVTNTQELGIFKIKKEQASSSGVRRIKAVLKI